MDDSTPVGFNRRDAVRIENTVLDYEHRVIDGRTQRKQAERQNDEPQLFIALEAFSRQSGSATNCRGSHDAWVGRAAKLEYDSDRTQNTEISRQAYNRIDGEAHCVWMPAETDCGVGAADFNIRCGQYFWGIWNGQSGRYEAVSPLHRTEDSDIGTVNCPCKWFGYATWKVVVTDSVAAWVLDENRCSGCYTDDIESRPDFDGGMIDHRFETTTLNPDWLQEPSPSAATYAPGGDYDENFRYVTCCGTTPDDPPDPPCDPLTCCYTVPVWLPRCETATVTSQTIMRYTGCSASGSGYWRSGSYELLNYTESEDCCVEHPEYSPIAYLSITLNSVSLTPTSLTYDLSVRWGVYRDPSDPMSYCRQDHIGYVSAVYSIASQPTCSNDPVATRVAVYRNIGAGTEFIQCTDDTCGLTIEDIVGLFPSSVTVTRIACDETTTTSTSTSTTSTTSTTTSTTTVSSTTGTTSSTTSSTTTESTTTGSTTTGSTTTGSTTTQAPCTDSFCTYTWDGMMWVLTIFCIGSGSCGCSNPGFSGTFVGQTTTVACT